MPAAKTNGTLMAHRGLGHDRCLTFLQVELGVELGGLEPPTPCLQNTCRLSDTVAHLGLWPRRVDQDRFVSDPVVVSFGGQLQPCRPQAAGLALPYPSWPAQCRVEGGSVPAGVDIDQTLRRVHGRRAR